MSDSRGPVFQHIHFRLPPQTAGALRDAGERSERQGGGIQSGDPGRVRIPRERAMAQGAPSPPTDSAEEPPEDGESGHVSDVKRHQIDNPQVSGLSTALRIDAASHELASLPTTSLPLTEPQLMEYTLGGQACVRGSKGAAVHARLP